MGSASRSEKMRIVIVQIILHIKRSIKGDYSYFQYFGDAAVVHCRLASKISEKSRRVAFRANECLGLQKASSSSLSSKAQLFNTKSIFATSQQSDGSCVLPSSTSTTYSRSEVLFHMNLARQNDVLTFHWLCLSSSH
jgi:hypothetical protein